MTEDLWICRRKAHLPEYDDATGYFYFEPVKPYNTRADLCGKPVEDAEVREAISTVRNPRNCGLILAGSVYGMAVETLIRSATAKTCGKGEK